MKCRCLQACVINKTVAVRVGIFCLCTSRVFWSVKSVVNSLLAQNGLLFSAISWYRIYVCRSTRTVISLVCLLRVVCSCQLYYTSGSLDNNADHSWPSLYSSTHWLKLWLSTEIKLNKNLAVANRSRVSCAHNTSRSNYPWPWNLG